VLTEDARHHALLDEALAALDVFADLLHLKLDEKAALKIVEAALRTISEVRRDRDHEGLAIAVATRSLL
jgi:hypothetical protein